MEEVFRKIDNKTVGLNKTQKKVVMLLIENEGYTAEELSKIMGVTSRTIERALKQLQEKEIIVREGSKRDGNWVNYFQPQPRQTMKISSEVFKN